ncbi:MAG: hypothetical protein PHX04_05470 [Bacilli bacterium]|nr:hypothetical protein [Bacilli bacterium]
MNKKSFKITSIVIATIILLGIIFATFDYNLAKNGKKPWFSWYSSGISSYNVKVAGDNETKDNETKEKEEETIFYKGLGYKLVTCTDCKQKVKMFLLTTDEQKYYYDDLRCKLNNQVLIYTFKESKLINASISETIPKSDIVDADIFQEEILEFNNIDNCGSTINNQKNYNDFETYKKSKYCDINQNLDNNVSKEFLLKSEYLSLSKKELIKKLKNDNPKLLCD